MLRGGVVQTRDVVASLLMFWGLAFTAISQFGEARTWHGVREQKRERCMLWMLLEWGREGCGVIRHWC
jgi:hypothetical protein